MTLPGADEAQPPGLGHRSPEPSLVKEPQRTHAHAMTEHADHSGHPHRNGHESPRSRRHGNHAESRLREEHPGHADPSGHDGHAEHAVMGMRELRLGTELAWVFATYILLFGALWLTAQWVPIRFV